ncbi:protein N-lysine methyltransferase METTL21A-like [Branchiostoma floridae x Branchiostoma belcheri]
MSGPTFSFCGHDVTIHEQLADCGVGATIWDSSIILSRFMEQTELELADKSVLELGAGTGLVSIVASLLGAKVTTTDCGETLPCAWGNVPRNTELRAKHAPVVRRLEWGTADLDDFGVQHYDYIMGSDIIYKEETFPDLHKTIMHLAGAETVLYLAGRIRFSADEDFLDTLKQDFYLSCVYEDPIREVYIYRGEKLRNSKT